MEREVYGTRAEALRAETEAILHENPVHNVAGTVRETHRRLPPRQHVQEAAAVIGFDFHNGYRNFSSPHRHKWWFPPVFSMVAFAWEDEEPWVPVSLWQGLPDAVWFPMLAALEAART